MASDTVIRPSREAVFRELADGTGVILHLNTTAYHGVNRTGVVIWRLLESNRTFEGLVEELRSRLDGAPPNLETEVAEFVNDLRDRELVVFGNYDPAGS